MTTDELNHFAVRYAKAWCSQDPQSVAACFAENASMIVNGGAPTPPLEIARGFMRDFPDMVVKFDRLENTSNGIDFHWTLTGTNTGPGGTGNHIRISGYELWKINDAGLIAKSIGHFDAAEYDRQLKHGSES